ncbi:MAG: GAF domain-containing protein [Oligoflexus sp.]
MPVTAIADYEEARLKNLYSHDILDTDPEPEFEQIVKIARELCKVPICLISLVDRDRQWFKARLGLGICETAREVSFCSQAVAARDILMVADALDDPRFQSNPLVVNEPKIRFYLGIPLLSEEGYPLGTLCVIDTAPRNLEHRQMEMLTSLSELTAILLTKRKKFMHNNSKQAVQVVPSSTANDVKNYARFYQSVFARTLRNFAHEVNNPLAIAMGASEQLIDRLNHQDEMNVAQLQSSMQMMQSSTARISETFRSYLRLILQSQEGQEYQSVIAINYLNDLMSMFQSKLRNLGMSCEIHCQCQQHKVLIQIPETSVLLFGCILFFLTQQGSGLKRADNMALYFAGTGDRLTCLLQYTERKNAQVEKSGDNLMQYTKSISNDVGHSLYDLIHLAKLVDADIKLSFENDILASVELSFKTQARD